MTGSYWFPHLPGGHRQRQFQRRVPNARSSKCNDRKCSRTSPELNVKIRTRARFARKAEPVVWAHVPTAHAPSPDAPCSLSRWRKLTFARQTAQSPAGEGWGEGSLGAIRATILPSP
jgi:hypothetical protein